MSSPTHTRANTVEPWLRGTLTDLDPLRRQVLHAIDLTQEDIDLWCRPLPEVDLNTRPFGLPSVAFQIRHIGRSLDRLLTYAAGRDLLPDQLAALAAEGEPDATNDLLFSEFDAAINTARGIIRSTDPVTYADTRGVGRAHLPTTVGSLLIHCAEHSQRHTGQAITTAKLVTALRQT